MSVIAKLKRTGYNGRWQQLGLIIKMDNGRTTVSCIEINNSNINEDIGLSNLLDRFESHFHSENLRSRIIQGFNELSEMDVGGNSYGCMTILVVQEELGPHF